MMDFVGKKRWFFLVSGILIIAGIISLAIFGLRPGTDFAGGTSLTLQFSPVDGGQVDWSDFQGQLRDEMTNLGYGTAAIQNAGGGSFIIHIQEITSDEAQALAQQIAAQFDFQVDITDYYSASPTVGAQTARNAGIAVIIAAVAMLFYIVWAFRRMPNPFRWGTCAVIALGHDVFIIIGIFSILGWLAGVEIDALFITGLLAVVGYSINNTVVIFDRIRENLSRHVSPDFGLAVNSSIVETLGRSLNTSLTTLFVILALFLFGGATIHYFVLVLLLGVIIGTYDSIFVAGPLLVVWEKGEWSALLPWVKRPA
jgi:preprotein translocase subunit SecF